MTTMFGGGACANDEEAKEPTISNKERATLFTMCLLAVRTSTSSLSNTSGTCFGGPRLLEPKTIAPPRSHFALPTDSITSPSHGRRLRVEKCGKRIDIAEGRACSVDRFDFSSPGAGFISADANEVANALSTKKLRMKDTFLIGGADGCEPCVKRPPRIWTGFTGLTGSGSESKSSKSCKSCLVSFKAPSGANVQSRTRERNSLGSHDTDLKTRGVGMRSGRNRISSFDFRYNAISRARDKEWRVSQSLAVACRVRT